MLDYHTYVLHSSHCKKILGCLLLTYVIIVPVAIKNFVSQQLLQITYIFLKKKKIFLMKLQEWLL